MGRGLRCRASRSWGFTSFNDDNENDDPSVYHSNGALRDLMIRLSSAGLMQGTRWPDANGSRINRIASLSVPASDTVFVIRSRAPQRSTQYNLDGKRARLRALRLSEVRSFAFVVLSRHLPHPPGTAGQPTNVDVGVQFVPRQLDHPT